MATASYSRTHAQPNQNRARRTFGQGIAPTAKRPPSGPGWFDPTKPDNHPDRLTLAELRALGREPKVESDAGTHFSSFAHARPTVDQFVSFLEATASTHARHGGPHAAWLAAHLRTLARQARSLDAADGPTLDEREEACLLACVERAEVNAFAAAARHH
jgi:hypothetical protein